MNNFINTHINHKRAVFWMLTALTILFFLFEIGIFFHENEVYLGDYKLIADRLQVPPIVLVDIFLFFVAQFALHIIFLFSLWVIILAVNKVLHLSKSAIERLTLFLWIVSVVALLLFNQHNHPNSKFSSIITNLTNPLFAKIILSFCVSSLIVVYVFAIDGIYKFFIERKKLSILLLVLVGLFIGGSVYSSIKNKQVVATVYSQPNIFIIGIDSLRPDHIGFFNSLKKTPHLDDFLANATVFSNSWTPLARTFPSWTSILTGEYPKTTNTRSNLTPHRDFDSHQTLASILQKHGYQTVFATDETRFSNIDAHFGFNQIITPPIGFNDFFLGSLSDFPLSNLMVNTFLGKYLFPHSYGNRPVISTYDPNSFLNLIKPTLTAKKNKPLFLAVHFCLPHTPYIWKSYNDKNWVNRYTASVARVDEQVNDFLVLLKKNKLLEHSIVVILSDHGEALELPGDRITESHSYIPGKDNFKKIIPQFYPKSTHAETVNQSAGHGTDVLGLTQYHVLLGVRFYGIPGQMRRVISDQVSLLDIKPTLLSLLGIRETKGGIKDNIQSEINNNQSGNLELAETKQKHNSNSLSEYILGKKTQSNNVNHFFVESDFSTAAVRSVHPETRTVLFQGINYFQVNKATTRLTVKKSMEDLVISSKQYADYYGPWILALYPRNIKSMIPILVNKNTGQWTDDLRTDFAKQAPTDEMVMALRNFFKKDIKEIETYPLTSSP